MTALSFLTTRIINTVFTLLKQKKDESSKHSPLERKNAEGLSKGTREQRKSYQEGKFYGFKADALPSVYWYLHVSDTTAM